eukprot:jgi/Psemu1/312451/fgenesh1_kg.954_\
MKIVLSSVVLASVLAPAFSFSYLDTLGGGAAPVAYSEPAAPEPAFEPPVAAAPAPYVPAPAAEVAPAGNYFDSLNTSEHVRGPGLHTHVDSLNTGATAIGGAGLQSFTACIPPTSAVSGGPGLTTYTDALSPSNGATASYNPFGSSTAAPSFEPFAGVASGDGVSFTLETGDISGLVQDLQAGGTLRLSGSIDSISYN